MKMYVVAQAEHRLSLGLSLDIDLGAGNPAISDDQPCEEPQ